MTCLDETRDKRMRNQTHLYPWIPLKVLNFVDDLQLIEVKSKMLMHKIHFSVRQTILLRGHWELVMLSESGRTKQLLDSFKMDTGRSTRAQSRYYFCTLLCTLLNSITCVGLASNCNFANCFNLIHLRTN